MHEFDYDWPHQHDLNEAHSWICDQLKKRTKCDLVSKDKYGVIIYEHILVPGWDRPLLYTWNQCWLYRKWQLYAWKKLWQIVQEAVEKYPHLQEELEEDIACNEEIVGTEVHKKYWRTVNE